MLLAMPEPPSAKSVSVTASVSEVDVGATETAPPDGAVESCVTVNVPGVEESPALLLTATVWPTVGPVVVASKVTAIWLPVCVGTKFAPPFAFSGEKV